MKNIHSIPLPKYQTERFQFIRENIHKSLDDETYRITLSMELEKDEDTQYPIEDILDEYGLYATDHIVTEEKKDRTVLEIELAGDLEGIESASNLIGKRAYNQTDKDGSISLVISST